MLPPYTLKSCAYNIHKEVFCQDFAVKGLAVKVRIIPEQKHFQAIDERQTDISRNTDFYKSQIQLQRALGSDICNI